MCVMSKCGLVDLASPDESGVAVAAPANGLGAAKDVPHGVGLGLVHGLGLVKDLGEDGADTVVLEGGGELVGPSGTPAADVEGLAPAVLLGHADNGSLAVLKFITLPGGVAMGPVLPDDAGGTVLEELGAGRAEVEIVAIVGATLLPVASGVASAGPLVTLGDGGTAVGSGDGKDLAVGESIAGPVAKKVKILDVGGIDVEEPAIGTLAKAGEGGDKVDDGEKLHDEGLPE